MSGGHAKVSLIVPVYNVKDYLGRCLESCREQTLRDLEIICVDDGSTDCSGEMLDRFAEEDSRVTVIHKKNGGLSSARNAGLAAASGTWIMFLDSDDYLAPNACERVWVESQEAWTEIIIFGTQYFPEYPVPDNDQWLRDTLTVRTKRFTSFKPEILFHEPGSIPFVWRQAYSSEFLKKNKLQFDETAKFAEDILFQFYAFPRAKFFAFISDPLYHYRIGRKDSLMDKASKNPVDKIEWHIKIVEKVIENWEKDDLQKQYKVELANWAMDYVTQVLIETNNPNPSKYLDQLDAVLAKHNLSRAVRWVPGDTLNVISKLRKRKVFGTTPGERRNRDSADKGER